MLTGIRKKRWIKVIIATLMVFGFGCFLFYGASSVSAQTTDFGASQFEEATALSGTDIRVIIAKIIRAALGLLGIIAVIIIIYAGYVIMTSGGEEEKITKGKKILINATIGLAIILSAFTIAQFILNALTGNLQNGGSEGGGAPAFESFTGSGALGHIIKDHYPFRDQTGVARNTWISVTFREPINAFTIIDNTNNTCLVDGSVAVCPGASGDIPVYGDCVEPAEGEVFDWNTDCDQLKTNAVEIYRADAETPVYLQATALTGYEDGAERNTLSFTFRPLESLGSSAEDVDYIVRLTNAIKKKNNDDVFSSTAGGEYWWQFQTGTNFDFDPPRVDWVVPSVGERVARNKVVKIVFTEAVNPVTAQGVLNNPAGNSFTNIIFNTTTVQGEWKISNGYRTAEFIPSDPCGTNSCGDTVYCLPIGSSVNNKDYLTNYKTLIRTASLLEPASSWGTRPPFSGTVDMAGNALDGNGDGVRNNKPAMPSDFEIFDEAASETVLREEQPDNYFWNFIVENRIELRPVFANEISPTVDASFVPDQAVLSILFDSVMLHYSLSDLQLEEYPAHKLIPNSDGELLPDIWFRPLAEDKPFAIGEVTATRTKATLDHRDFGPNDMDLFYFPSIPSTVLNDYQNCLYPGRGPATESKNCVYSEDANGAGTSAGCLPDADIDGDQFQFTEGYYSRDTGCAHTDDVVPGAFDTLAECLNSLRVLSTVE